MGIPKCGIARREVLPVDRPAENELQRAEALLDSMHRSVAIAVKYECRVCIDLDVAQELCQLLADSIRTAKRLQQGGA